MASSLAEYVVLKSKDNGKYLEYVKEGEVQGYVRFSGEDVHSPQSKFHVERAESDSQLVHLRCCYNNKYLVASSLHWIAAEADKPEEDQSEWSCTLFHPVSSGDHEYRFKHVKSGNYAALMRTGDSDPKNNCLYPERAAPGLLDVCTVIDWKTLLVLPRHVAFRGDNDTFLVAPVITLDNAIRLAIYQGHSHLTFAKSDSGDETAAHEVFPNPDGSIRLKSTFYGKFWRASPEWIWADSPYTSTDDTDAIFWPVKVDDNTIALRQLGNDRFCKRVDDRLGAVASSISKEVRLQVTELALCRDIYNVNYHLSRATRYNEHAVIMGTGAASNTTGKENSMDVKVVHTETDTKSWGGSVSLKLGVKTSLKAKVPMIVEEKIEISAELTTAFQWGEVHTKTNTVETVYKALVPPMTKATVTAVGTTAMCDIPFSYTKTDTLMDGTQVTHDTDGGTYTGVSTFNVTYEVKHEKINVTVPKVE